jgi:hypothetical protein
VFSNDAGQTMGDIVDSIRVGFFKTGVVQAAPAPVADAPARAAVLAEAPARASVAARARKPAPVPIAAAKAAATEE